MLAVAMPQLRDPSISFSSILVIGAVVAARLGLELDVFDETSGATLVAAGLLSVIAFPPIALWLLGDGDMAGEDTERLGAPLGPDLGDASPA